MKPIDARRSSAERGPLKLDGRGSVVVEAAFAIPMLVVLLCAMLAYGSWFMTAHSLQQAANEAARAALAGLDSTERRALVDQSVAASGANSLFTGTRTIGVSTTESAGYYSVTLRYDLASVPVFAASPFPLPATILQRSAVVRIGA
ncbi:MAG: TadE/TadG family type IV pilus assembly protein [Sphingobium sp.]